MTNRNELNISSFTRIYSIVFRYLSHRQWKPTASATILRLYQHLMTFNHAVNKFCRVPIEIVDSCRWFIVNIVINIPPVWVLISSVTCSWNDKFQRYCHIHVWRVRRFMLKLQHVNKIDGSFIFSVIAKGTLKCLPRHITTWGEFISSCCYFVCWM